MTSSARPLPEVVQNSELWTKFDSDGTTHHRYRLRNGEINWESWVRDRQIGKGGFSEVWLEKEISTPQRRAVKAIKLRASTHISQDPDDSDTRHSEDLMNLDVSDYSRELETLATFSGGEYSDMFVEWSGWFKGESELCVALEYVPLGDLKSYIFPSPGQKIGTKIPEVEVCTIMGQLLRGLEFMHSEGFTHRDLKPANILVRGKPRHKRSPYNGWWVVLSDFGLSKKLDSFRTGSSGLVGSDRYMAPELFGETSEVDWTAADIWAIREIAFQLITGQHTFPHQKALFTYANDPKARFPTQNLKDLNVGRKGVDFIQRAMRAEHAYRMVAREALQHPWITLNTTETNTSHGPRKGKTHVPVTAGQSEEPRASWLKETSDPYTVWGPDQPKRPMPRGWREPINRQEQVIPLYSPYQADNYYSRPQAQHILGRVVPSQQPPFRAQNESDDSYRAMPETGRIPQTRVPQQQSSTYSEYQSAAPLYQAYPASAGPSGQGRHPAFPSGLRGNTANVGQSHVQDHGRTAQNNLPRKEDYRPPRFQGDRQRSPPNQSNAQRKDWDMYYADQYEADDGQFSPGQENDRPYYETYDDNFESNNLPAPSTDQRGKGKERYYY